MKTPLMHLRLVRLTCLPALLILSACSSKPAPEPGQLDLGGGISMTADGQIVGATRARPSHLPPDEGDPAHDNIALAAAVDHNPLPPGAPTPLFFSSAAQWHPAPDRTASRKTPGD